MEGDQLSMEIAHCVEQAQAAWLTHDYVRARTWLRMAYKRDPGNAQVISMLAEAEKECRNLKPARSIFLFQGPPYAGMLLLVGAIIMFASSHILIPGLAAWIRHGPSAIVQYEGLHSQIVSGTAASLTKHAAPYAVFGLSLFIAGLTVFRQSAMSE